jgi:hypothetical protein
MKTEEKEDKIVKLGSKFNIFLFGWRYYHNYYREKPKSICPLFWEGMLGLILFIITPVVNLITLIKAIFQRESFLRVAYLEDNRASQRFLYQIFLLFIYWIMVLCVLEYLGGMTFTLAETPLWVLLYGWIFPIIILGCLVGLIWLIIMGVRKIPHTIKINLPGNLLVIKEVISAKYNKMCWKIEWKD